MEQTGPRGHVRPKIEEVVYSPSLQCRKYLLFVDTVIREHGKDISDVELEEINKLNGTIATSIMDILRSRR
jgi:hypothetical protein